MGILSKIFRKSLVKEKSFIEWWVGQKQINLSSSLESKEDLFVALMKVLADFKLETDLNESQPNDTALFELGCYLYIRIDVWLLQNKPERRNELSTFFVNCFNKLFERALNRSDINQIFNNRVAGFAELVQIGAELKAYHFHLVELVLAAYKDKPLEEYSFKTQPIIRDYLQDITIKLALGSWEETKIPLAIYNLEYYCKSTQR